MVRACEAFLVFLLVKEFIIRTDHRAQVGIFSSTLQTMNNVVKWVMRLQPYKFKIEIVKGKDNVVAEDLSRIPWKTMSRASEQVETPELNLMMLEVDD